jgi:hypothetical protein
MGEQMCPRCGGAKVTEKVRYSVDLDENGNQAPRQESYTSPCEHCGGKGWVNG